jgi:predicted AlkP superfamily phosphohydrolase/phosphomutase
MIHAASRARVLVIGLDMGDEALLRHWIGERRLPHFAALASSGAWVRLESTAEVLHTSTWPTFATGTSPGRHGVYYPYQPRPGFQLARHIEPDAYGASPFWTMASAAGLRCVLYDIPETFADSGFKGCGIFDWGTWARYGEPSGQPGDLLRQLKSRFGPYPLGFEAKRLGLAWPDNIEPRLLRAVRYKQLTAQWLLERGDWDLAAVGLCETHPAGHYLWPRGADDVASSDETSFEPLFRVYAAVDEALGALQQTAPPDTTVVVASGDGVRPNRTGWHLLPAILQRLGYARSGGEPPAGSARSSPSLLSRVQGLVPAGAKQLAMRSLPWRLRNELGVWIEMRGIDWSRTRAFTLPTDLEGCIRINVRGREPRGIVEPGAQYDDLCEEIRERLEELIQPATGEPAVRRVWLRNQVFPGPRQEQLPDIVVTWNDRAPLVSVSSPRIGLVEGANPDPRPGTHSSSGFVLAAGPGIRRDGEARGHLMDVAPSLLWLTGVTTMHTFDGRPLPTLTGGRVAPEAMPRAATEAR